MSRHGGACCFFPAEREALNTHMPPLCMPIVTCALVTPNTLPAVAPLRGCLLLVTPHRKATASRNALYRVAARQYVKTPPIPYGVRVWKRWDTSGKCNAGRLIESKSHERAFALNMLVQCRKAAICVLRPVHDSLRNRGTARRATVGAAVLHCFGVCLLKCLTRLCDITAIVE